MTPIRAAVFDLDGTLIDSVPDIAAALNRCLVDEARVALTDEAVAKLVGGGARELVARALGPATPAAAVDRIHAAFLAHYDAEPVARTRLYPGARDLLQDLRETGLPLAICTNKPQHLTDLILDRLGLTAFFSVIWGAVEGQPLKPDAACLRTVCQRLGTNPAETVMVGDSHTDIDPLVPPAAPQSWWRMVTSSAHWPRSGPMPWWPGCPKPVSKSPAGGAMNERGCASPPEGLAPQDP